MKINKVEIYNFRSHKKTSVELSTTNILIGQNNAGKTAFLDAINYALNRKSGTPTEDDFSANQGDFNPKKSDPIKVILEFRESKEDRFSENIFYNFDKAIRYDEYEYVEDPIKFIRFCYEYKYDTERDRYVEERYFVDEKSEKIRTDPFVQKKHLSFSPVIHLTTLRDINKEIKSKSSFWGKLKGSIDYKNKEKDIQEYISKINDLIFEENETMDGLILKLEELKNNINISSESLKVKAFAKRDWELLDDLDIYLKSPNSGLELPVCKHGMGIQNIAIFCIFNAYLDIVLPKIVENEEATPIICIEEPEAHVHPHAQRSIFYQMQKMDGQKIISTHSPYIVDQADIYDYILVKNERGTTQTKKIPKWKKDFKFKYGLPEIAYKNLRYLTSDEQLLIKRYVQYRNTELFFSSLFILCEGDSEKVLLENLFPYYEARTPGQFGISIISCEGQTYSPFLKVTNEEAFNLKWIILSDAEEETVKTLRNTIENCGYQFESVKGRIKYLPSGYDIEKYYIEFYGPDEIKKIILNNYGDKSFDLFKKEFSEEIGKKGDTNSRKSIGDYSEEELLNIFIDKKGKVRFAEKVALHVISNKLKIPDVIEDVITKSIGETIDG